ncbi:unnamed protein product [Rotaria sp. Silwood2]|nr:unnamed protein product [Rotaria sp. Silwood2]CAF4154512.1 unnamed protein product [Rotaria sp. Silwood2]
MTFDCSGQSVCKNNEKCFQDHPNCPKRSICICPSCFYDTKYQFSTSGFGLSLDTILGYRIKPNINFQSQLYIVKISLTFNIIFLIIGFFK